MMGLVKRAHEFVIEKAPKRSISYTFYKTQTESPSFQLALAKSAMLVDTVWLMRYERAKTSGALRWKIVPMTYNQRARIRMDTGYVAETARQAMDILLSAHGASSFAEVSPLQRMWRDLETCSRTLSYRRRSAAKSTAKLCSGLRVGSRHSCRQPVAVLPSTRNLFKRKAAMPKAFRLVFCEFASANLAAEVSYYKDVIGAASTLESSDGTHYLSLGLDHHNIVLRPGATSQVLCSGFQVSAGTDLNQLGQECATFGIEYELKENARPGVPRLLEVAVAGHRFQFFSEMEMPAPGFSRGGIMPSRLGHIALMTPDAETLITFFHQVLGFYKTDEFDGLATFFTCNYDHHTMNIISAPITKLHHIAFELRGGGHQYLGVGRVG